MKRLVVAALVVALGSASAYAGGFMMLHVGSADGSNSGPPPTGALLLEDGVTPITLEDGVTPLCLEGGC